MSQVPFSTLLAQRVSRRALLQGASAALAVATLPGCRRADAPDAAGAAASASTARTGRGAFVPVSPQFTDDLVLARGYVADVVARWGDALFPDAPSLDPRAVREGRLLEAGAAARQARQFGTNCDAIVYFPFGDGGSERGVLCVNHEYVTAALTFAGLPRSGKERAAGRAAWIRAHPEAVPWMQATHGVSVLHVARERTGWRHVPGPLTRRITATTPCEIAGPARGAPLLRTAADPGGVRVVGTLANCAGGRTPWGTYLTAEENIQDYFGGAESWAAATGDAETRTAHARFRMMEASAYGWEHADPRFDVRREPREALRYGWIVEIDPTDPSSTPRKRTALGRFVHEAATTAIARDGRVAAYMGDDDLFEYVYKFVTRRAFDPRDRAANRDLLDEGTLYVARFEADGTGTWLPLVYDESGPLDRSAGFTSQADVVIRAREAADRLGATPMDRPEDIEPDPRTGRVYIACTKNKQRTTDEERFEWSGREAPTRVDAANPRPSNALGHVIELIEDGDDAAATRFRWNVFLLAGDPRAPGARFLVDADALASGALGAEDTWYGGYRDASAVSPFACPDNFGFDPAGRLWIVTDHDEHGERPNNGCFVVPTSGPERGRLQQLASGPVGCEICGCEFTPDGRTLFLAIQHPGEGGTVDEPVSHWPDGGGLPPRSSIVAVRREDGGAI